MAESFYEIFRRYFHDTDGTYLPPVLNPSDKADLDAVETLLQEAFRKQGIRPAKRAAFCVQTTNGRKTGGRNGSRNWRTGWWKRMVPPSS